MIGNIHNFRKINIIILTVYLSFVFFTQVFIRCNNYLIVLISSILLIFASYFISRGLTALIYNLRFDFNMLNISIKDEVIIRTIIFIIVLCIGFILLQLQWQVFTEEILLENTAYDIQDCVIQVNSGEYNNWHPFLYTILFIKIPLIIGGGSINAIYIFYVIVRSIVISYVISDIYINFNNKIFTLLLLVFYTLTPLSIYSTYSGLKDTPYGYFVLLFIYLIFKDLYFNKNTRDKNLDFRQNIFYYFLGLLLSFLTIFRHNSWFFTLPTIVILYLLYKNNINKFFKIIISFLIIFFFINIFLLYIFNVSSTRASTSKVEESMGMPLSVLSYIAKEKSDALNEKEFEFMDLISGHNMDAYNVYDERQGYDSIKPEEPFVSNRINVINDMNLGYGDFLSMFFDLMIREPKLTFRQIFNLTCGVYALRYRPATEGDPTSFIAKAYWLVGSLEIPFVLLLLISSILAFNNISNFNKYQVLLALPILLYTFGTMCLLSANGIHRYFISLQMTMPIYYLFNSNINKA